MDLPALLSGIALLVSASATVAAILLGRRQNERQAALDAAQIQTTTAVESDRIRSQANGQLIDDLQEDNRVLRERLTQQEARTEDLRRDVRRARDELRETRAQLREAEAKCESCQRRLDQLRHDVYGPNFDPDRRPPSAPPPDN